ncbi:MAG: hydroxymyristoyl-ACP dehydratase [Desulfuromonadales bacterium]|nr:hydroxymyristoyl-ACP dehydratase [Desulfuromonadales bacterium]
MFNPDPAAYLPHRYPFLLLDRVVELVPGVSAIAETTVSSSRTFSQVLLVESVAQLAGIMTVRQEGEGGFLAAITQAEFDRLPEAGDLLSVSVRLVKSFGRLFMVEGQVSCGESMLLKVQLTLGEGRL